VFLRLAMYAILITIYGSCSGQYETALSLKCPGDLGAVDKVWQPYIRGCQSEECGEGFALNQLATFI
jgi:hypothetical protein